MPITDPEELDRIVIEWAMEIMGEDLLAAWAAGEVW